MTVSAPASDCERDLAQILAELEELAAEASSAEQATRVANCLYRRASLTGDLAVLEAADAAVTAGLERFGDWPDLYFLQATVALELHRLEGVRTALARSPALRASPEGRALQADVDFQTGRYEDARRACEALLEAERTSSTLARLAELALAFGDDARADELYAEAEDELTAKELRSFCRLELRRGDAHLSRGRHAEAQSHFERAERAYSGHWLVSEHTAELLAAQGRVEEALALYRELVRRVPRPELQQALGDLCLRAGAPDEARRRHDLAESAYLEAVERGGVHYYHHLAAFYLDSRPQPAAAVRWARADVSLRPNFTTQAILARALHADGRLAEAAAAINAALASGSRDPHLLAAAEEIHLAADQAPILLRT